MKYLHTMIRVRDLDATLDFFLNKLGFVEQRRKESEKGRFTLVFIAPTADDLPLELTYNWDPEEYTGGRNFGHVAYSVENIYDYCARLQEAGIPILRPPRDGKMAFIRTPMPKAKARRRRRRDIDYSLLDALANDDMQSLVIVSGGHSCE